MWPFIYGISWWQVIGAEQREDESAADAADAAANTLLHLQLLPIPMAAEVVTAAVVKR